MKTPVDDYQPEHGVTDRRKTQSRTWTKPRNIPEKQTKEHKSLHFHHCSKQDFQKIFGKRLKIKFIKIVCMPITNGWAAVTRLSRTAVQTGTLKNFDER